MTCMKSWSKTMLYFNRVCFDLYSLAPHALIVPVVTLLHRFFICRILSSFYITPFIFTRGMSRVSCFSSLCLRSAEGHCRLYICKLLIHIYTNISKRTYAFWQRVIVDYICKLLKHACMY